jgi:hypothetical protein
MREYFAHGIARDARRPRWAEMYLFVSVRNSRCLGGVPHRDTALQDDWGKCLYNHEPDALGYRAINNGQQAWLARKALVISCATLAFSAG